MDKKQKLIIAGALSIGAIILLIYLLRQKQATIVGAATGAGNSSGLPQYPAPQTIPPSSFQVGGSPTYLTFASTPPLPDYDIANPDVGGCGCDPCGSATTLQVVSKIPPAVVKQAASNYSGYKAKVVTAISIPPKTNAYDQDFGTQGAG